ncbi:helicase [Aureococcus anophagefferens]|nr:helicase [Aureococcus anophagefferens]
MASKPAPAKSAYGFFTKSRHEWYSANDKSKPMGDRMKEISAAWKALGGGKKKFDKLAEQDRARFERESDEADAAAAAEQEAKRGATATRGPAAASAAEEKALPRKKREENIEEARGAPGAHGEQARLKYLLSQSDIFGHFGSGVTAAAKAASRGRDGAGAASPGRPRARAGMNGILADEMGLGKTLQSISVLGWLAEAKGVKGPHLVLVPKSTLGNWMNEFALPGCAPGERDWDVCVTTYEVAKRARAEKLSWRFVIIDEAHRIKNEASLFARTARSLRAERRLLVTGTPLQNNLHELWALLNFLLPDVFASSDQFDEWFDLDVEDEDAKKTMITQLHKLLRPSCSGASRSASKSLPPKTEAILFTGLSVSQKQVYKSLLKRDASSSPGPRPAATGRRGVEDRNLDPLGDHVVANCGKLVLLDKLLAKLKDAATVLVFSQMTALLGVLEDFMAMRDYEYCRIDGNTSYEERDDLIEAYNAPNSDKFADLQAMDRAHRIGQKKPVHVYRLVTANTIEEKIVGAQEAQALERAFKPKPRASRAARGVRRALPKLDAHMFCDGDRLRELGALEEERYRALYVANDGDAYAAACDAGVLGPELEAEKAALLAAGFPAWNKQRFRDWYRCVSRLGRENHGAVAEALGVDAAEVARYAAAFWARGALEIDEAEYQKALNAGGNLLEALPVDTQGQALKEDHDRPFSREEDRFLLVASHALGGPGADGHALAAAARASDRFLFDRFFLSQSPGDLAKRAGDLAKKAESILAEVERRERGEADRKSKKASSERRRRRPRELRALDPDLAAAAQAASLAEDVEKRGKALLAQRKKDLARRETDTAGAVVDAYLSRPPGAAGADHATIIDDCLKLLERKWDAESASNKQAYDDKLAKKPRPAPTTMMAPHAQTMMAPPAPMMAPHAPMMAPPPPMAPRARRRRAARVARAAEEPEEPEPIASRDLATVEQCRECIAVTEMSDEHEHYADIQMSKGKEVTLKLSTTVDGAVGVSAYDFLMAENFDQIPIATEPSGRPNMFN